MYIYIYIYTHTHICIYIFTHCNWSYDYLTFGLAFAARRVVGRGGPGPAARATRVTWEADRADLIVQC